LLTFSPTTLSRCVGYDARQDLTAHLSVTSLFLSGSTSLFADVGVLDCHGSTLTRQGQRPGGCAVKARDCPHNNLCYLAVLPAADLLRLQDSLRSTIVHQQNAFFNRDRVQFDNKMIAVLDAEPNNFPPGVLSPVC
jgi:hypothetical protein